MKLRVLYFASLREALGRAEEEVDFVGAASVGALRAELAARGGEWSRLAAGSVRAARNQGLCGPDEALADGDEVAFFPPVTGG